MTGAAPDPELERLVDLPTHRERVALAGARAPWPRSAHEVVEQAASRYGWPEGDTAALHRAMTGTDPVMSRPEGLEDDRRWWIVADEAWDWTVWRADDGALALEVVRAGWSHTAVTVVLDPDECAAYEESGVGALDDRIRVLRNS